MQPTATAQPAANVQRGGANVDLTLDPENSQALFRAREQLANRSLPSDAVGTTKDVAGAIAVSADGILPANSSITVKLDSLQSDSRQRYNFIKQNTLEVAKYPTAQFQGALGLTLLGREARPAVPALTDLLRSKEVKVRQQAAAALGKVGADAREAVPALAEALRDREWTVRRQAALALGEIGPAARPALPELAAAARDPNHLVNRVAADAIKRIRAEQSRDRR